MTRRCHSERECDDDEDDTMQREGKNENREKKRGHPKAGKNQMCTPEELLHPLTHSRAGARDAGEEMRRGYLREASNTAAGYDGKEEWWGRTFVTPSPWAEESGRSRATSECSEKRWTPSIKSCARRGFNCVPVHDGYIFDDDTLS